MGLKSTDRTVKGIPVNKVVDGKFLNLYNSDDVFDNIVGNGLVLHLDAGNLQSYNSVESENLLTYSEDFSNVIWSKFGGISVSSNTTTAPDGTLTADTATITTANSHALTQAVTVLANTQYTFSFYVLRGTATDLKYSVYNNTGAADIVASTSYYSQTSASTWTRISVTFTTPSGCTTASVYPIRDSASTGTAFVWGAQVERGSATSLYYPTVATAKNIRSTWFDLKGTNNGTLTNGPTYSSENGGSIVFDGTNDHVNCGTINLQQNFSLELWAYTSANSSWYFGQGTTTTNQGLHIGWYIYQNRGMIFGLYSNDLDTPSFNLQFNTWYHFVFTYNHTTYLKQFYSNGVLQNSGVGNAYAGSGQFNVGQSYSSGGFGFMNGRISNAKVYNRVLTANEVSQNFNALRRRYGV